jgi:hypothetical protein
MDRALGRIAAECEDQREFAPVGGAFRAKGAGASSGAGGLARMHGAEAEMHISVPFGRR